MNQQGGDIKQHTNNRLGIILMVIVLLIIIMLFFSRENSAMNGEFTDLGEKGKTSQTDTQEDSNDSKTNSPSDIFMIGPPPLDSITAFSKNGFDFENNGEGDDFIFIIDRSGSMSGPRFNGAKEALIRTIERLPSDKRFFAYLYDDRSEAMPGGGWKKATALTKKDAIKWVQGSQTRGGTNPISSLKEAFAMSPSTIWLLTDGQFNSGTVLQEIRRLNKSRKVRINTIALVDNVGEQVLKQIATENRGTYTFIK